MELESCGFCKVESQPVIGVKMGHITTYFCSVDCVESWAKDTLGYVEPASEESTSTNAFKQVFADFY